jgi:NADH:ubiquinone oxidoreductase subunit 6 (subunit J)
VWFEQILFFVAGIGALAGALGVVMLRNPFY